MKNNKVTDSIIYIGVNDKDIDLFENQYVVPTGITYNSYVILDDKIAVMDTVDMRKTDEWLTNLERALNGKKPDYLIVSHMESDHSDNIENLANKYPEMKIVGNMQTFKMLSQFFSLDLKDRAVTVKEGDTLNLGKHTLQFIMAPMVQHMNKVKKYYSQQMASENLEQSKKIGKMKQEDIILILLENMVQMYKHYLQKLQNWI